jgi:ankyrin repeat protein
MPPKPAPTRTLRERPDLDQLKRQAKELLDAFRAGDPDATKEVDTHYRNADLATFALHDAQLVLARAHGFDSWPRMKAFIDGVTVRRLVDAVRSGNLEAVRSMVNARPELVHVDVSENDEHRALHHAVLQRHPEIVRFLMQQGADAGKGIWPHREATAPYTLAVERGYEEIVAIIKKESENEESENEEHRQGVSAQTGAPASQATDDTADTRGPDAAAREAIASGAADRLRALRTEGRLRDGQGLVSHAVAANRPDMLTLVLDLGLDPDESGRVGGLEEVVPTFGEPLRTCAMTRNLTMAEILLAHGANPNTNVYAASSALYEAYKRHDDPMIATLEQHGGRLTAVAIAELRLVDQAVKLLAEVVGSPAAPQVALDLLWGAIEAPSPEIIDLALRAVDWPRDDSRWHGILENGLYLGSQSDRRRQLDAFRPVLDRADPNVSDSRGMTLLHHVAASRGGLTAEDRVVYTTLLLDRGARIDIRDNLLRSTPLGWACRWGRVEMVRLLLERGADPIEADAEPWATPVAWATKRGHAGIVALLQRP